MHYIVSILVFVELALGPHYKTTSKGLIACFNPCFHGTRSRTPMSPELDQYIEVFQSLFSWNSLSDLNNPR